MRVVTLGLALDDPDFDVALENAGGFTMDLFQSHLALRVHCSILSSPG
jgi:hypothetical protein